MASISNVITLREASKGLAFLIAAKAALPNTLGDRARSAALNDLMGIAIETKMAFGFQEGAAIAGARLGMRTSVGVFDPLDVGWYHRACLAGGSYARMWEAHHGVSPFIASTAYTRDGKSRNDSRMAPDMAVVLKGPDGAAGDPHLAHTHGGHAIWWCTSVDLDAGKIVLCRYRHKQPSPVARPGSQMLQSAAPAQRMKLTREQWAQLQARMVDLEGNQAA